MSAIIHRPAATTLTRLHLESKELKQQEALFDAHLRESAGRLGQSLGVHNVQFLDKKIDPATAKATVTGLASHFHFRPLPIIHVTGGTGVQKLSPPYDVSWQLGAGLPVSAWDGDAGIFGANGFSASGFGIHVSASAHVSVSIMPQGQYTAGWVTFDKAAQVRSSGGTGAVVYHGSDIVLEHLTKVWDVSAPLNAVSQRFDMPFADTATPPAPNTLGPITLAPLFFEMQAGQRNLVWFYLWQLNDGVEGKPFLVFSQAQVPFITVSISAPQIIH
jgi:hypothetical protein